MSIDMKKRFLPIVLLMLTIALSSCGTLFSSDEIFKGGVILDDAKLSEIKAEVFGEKGVDEDTNRNSANDMTENEPSNDINDSKEPETVYWTAGGSAWHIYEDCGYLKRSKEIFSGSVNEAREQGKEKVCSSCDKKYN